MASTQRIEERIERIRARYPEPRAALLPALYAVQAERGFVADDDVPTIARLLDIPEVRVREVATWYTMFHRRKVGRHLVEVCTNLSCHMRGGDELLRCLCRELGVEPGQTTRDGRFTVREVECLGSCGTAPVMQVDGEFHENLTPERALEVLRDLDASA